MNIIVVGDGKVGVTLTEYLSHGDYDIMVIDRNPKVIQNVINAYDVMGINGNGANYETLMEAGAAKADLLIAATSSDEINILSCLMAKKIGTKHTIARVRNPEHARQLVFLREELGLSMVVNPELEAAREISRILRFPSAIKLDCFSKGRIDLAEIKIPENGQLADKRLSELYGVCKAKILICIVLRGEDVFIPNGDFVLKAGDHIHITGSHESLATFFKSIGMFKEKSKHITILGGGKIAYYLAHHMECTGVDLKIIEQDEARCIELAEALPKTTIVCGDGTDSETLMEEGLAESDACVALMGIDEENVITSLFARSLGVDTVITKIDRIPFLDMVEGLGLDSFISPKDITASRIIRYVRSMQVSSGNGIKTLYKMVNDRVEALEFSVSEDASYVGVPLKDLKTKKGILIAGIIRRGRVIIPGGEDHLEPKDSVLIVTIATDLIKHFEDILD